ncbi:MAG: alginate export family protein [Acetobacter sp.]|nr:alginate export family protein [Acetobacter sp.]
MMLASSEVRFSPPNKTFPPILLASTILSAILLTPPDAIAETSPNSQIRQHSVVSDTQQADVMSRVEKTQAKTLKSNDIRLLPPLGSRPELYAQPQNLELKPASSALLHQGPWGVFNANTGAASGFGTVGYYAVNRWAEDWSNLADPKNRIDVMDPLKYIPFNDSGSIYLSLSGNFRNHMFYDQFAGFGTLRKSPALRATYRWTGGADLHLGKHVRLYGELLSAQAGGSNYFGYAGGRWRSKLDAQQAFIEIKGDVLGAKTGIMVGRMAFLDAPPYFTAGSVYPTVPYSWNGVRGYAFWKNFRVDLFDLTLTNWSSRNIPFHDQVGYKTRLFGAYTSYAVPSFKFMNIKSQIFVDTFYFGYILSNSFVARPTGSMAGSTHRDTPGVRVWGNAGPIEFSLGGMWQGGEFNAAKNGPTRSVSAYSFNAQIAWRFRNLIGHPTLGIQADDISGGDTRKSTTSSWGNFLSPFVPSAYALDLSTYIGNSNLIDVGPMMTIAPTSNTSLLLKVPVVWRNSVNDGVYSNPTALYSFRPRGGYTATMPQASFTWRATRHISLSLDGEYLFASQSMINAGARSGAYVQSNLELTF